MTKEKWNEILNEEVGIRYENILNNVGCGKLSPYSWSEYKKANLIFIKSMDEATEIFLMENKEK